ncbi:hypothetical protein CHLRE_08g375650v5 [Chlamydomonas reinhardtii]|uniref:Cns1/TTC4 wheel domain-containing protein n=1 Tax=Chlamydomonas reinhardtii TaxID=3055 RepID=A0A2K3DHN8_CHLRE|nr:uncharacterized protein CHLRE_08g375650v5 [Chlamydomonas reinhardtii]PNW80046.1 hypothetical protein CHLRE_08g375650v5 [Chlamydomonas reinhardtii]
MSDSDSEDERPKPKLIDDNKGLHPLFWDALPEDAEDDPLYAALKAVDDELSPEEKAESFKTNGNNKLKLALSDKADQAAKRTLLREAVQFYSSGLELAVPSDALNAALHCNRAHVQIMLGNFRKAYNDALAARKLQPGNIKALFRAARAASRLGMWEQVEALCQEGRTADPASKEFDGMAKEASSKLAERRQVEERLRAQAEAEAAPARALVDVLLAHGCKMTRPQVTAGSHNKPSLSADGRGLVWPVLLLYPESGQQDVVEAWAEDDCFNEHLDMMFDPEGPPLQWDGAGAYVRDRVELYYLAHAGRPLTREQLVEAMQGRWPTGLDAAAGGPEKYGSRAARMRRINPKHTLRQVLAQEDHVVAGVPLFFVVAKGTPFREAFLESGR